MKRETLLCPKHQTPTVTGQAAPSQLRVVVRLSSLTLTPCCRCLLLFLGAGLQCHVYASKDYCSTCCVTVIAKPDFPSKFHRAAQKAGIHWGLGGCFSWLLASTQQGRLVYAPATITSLA